MSELESDGILEEIHALEESLTTEVLDYLPEIHYEGSTEYMLLDIPQQHKSSADCAKNAEDTCISESLEVAEAEDELNDTGENIEKLRAALNLNKQLIDCLTGAKEQITYILQECEEKLQILTRNLEQSKKSWSIPRSGMRFAGMPYFKDKDHFPAPRNEDTMLKAARGELQVVKLQKVGRWTPKDRKILMNAIYQEAITSLLRKNEKENTETNNLKCIKKEDLEKRIFPNDFKDVIGPLGSREFDWLKISATDFGGKHSAEECRVMWNVFLHPDINKCKWTRADDVKLQKIAKNYKFQDWDKIAKKLNKNRSGYQCFIRYNTINRLTGKGRPWVKKEDDKLLDIVARLRIGDFVPWGDVASYMHDRSKQQVYFRWTYSVAPHLKKGRFTKEEDTALMEGVLKFGPKFSKISAYLIPHRSTTQLHVRYNTLTRERGSPWTITEDKTLIELYSKLGPKWSRIAKSFKRKSRTQVRHRFASLCKFIEKGISISDIPRNDTENCNEELLIDSTEHCTVIPVKNNCIQDAIDRKLIEYFRELSNPRKLEYKQRQECYDSEQLAQATKMLYRILQMLKADLNIPDNINYIHLNQRDKQLLHSLKQYMKTKTNLEARNELAEQYRLRMFGQSSPVRENERFIPPLPSETYPKQRKKKTKESSESIDYLLDTNVKHMIEISTEFETPEFVIISLGGLDEEMQFRKVSDTLCREYQRECRKQNKLTNTVFRHTNNTNAFPGSSIRVAKQLLTKKRTDACVTVPGLFETKSRYYPNLIVSDTGTEDTIDSEGKEGIEPNKITLISYKNLVSLKEMYELEHVPECSKYAKTEACRNAYSLLKERLLLLFKYPICFSHISLLESYGEELRVSSDNRNSVNTENCKSNTARKRKKNQNTQSNKIIKLDRSVH